MSLALPTPEHPVHGTTARDVVSVAGPEAVAFLQGQLSQDVAALAVGSSARSFLLQPDGKVAAWLRATRLADDEVQLDVDAGWGPAVVARLERFKLRTKADITLAERVLTVSVRGVSVEGWLDAGAPDAPGSDALVVPGRSVTAPPSSTEVGPEQLEALRVATGVPAMGSELTEATIPAEAGQWVIDASVSFTKGCYTGQELVARIDSRGGNVPKRLRRILADGASMAVGAEVEVAGEVVGAITSSAAIDGGAVALAFVKRSVVPPVAATIAGASVTIEDVAHR